MRAFLVLTTIRIPTVAQEYCINFQKFNHQEEIGILIIGDRKSPNTESNILCRKLQKQGFIIEYFSITRQQKWLKKYPKLNKIIPYNSDNRRNIGYLMAFENGCDFVISIDDDNFPLPQEDFFAKHSIVGTKQKLSLTKTTSGWFNVCDLLEKSPNERIYPRGFPYFKRWKNERISKKIQDVMIGANAGLWINDPDVDSITRLNKRIMTPKFIGSQIALDRNCFSPINTQNTAIRSDLIPAYYFVLMGEKVDDLIIDRYGDIWSGFFLKKILDALGLYVSFGHPLTNHIRNNHNLFLDLKQELGCIIYTDYLVQLLQDIRPQGKTVIEIYDNLSDELFKRVSRSNNLSADFKRYVRKLHFCQKIWLETAQKISDSRPL